MFDLGEHVRRAIFRRLHQHCRRQPPFRPGVLRLRERRDIVAGVAQGPEHATIRKGDRIIEAARAQPVFALNAANPCRHRA